EESCAEARKISTVFAATGGTPETRTRFCGTSRDFAFNPESGIGFRASSSRSRGPRGSRASFVVARCVLDEALLTAQSRAVRVNSAVGNVFAEGVTATAAREFAGLPLEGMADRL